MEEKDSKCESSTRCIGHQSIVSKNRCARQNHTFKSLKMKDAQFPT